MLECNREQYISFVVICCGFLRCVDSHCKHLPYKERLKRWGAFQSRETATKKQSDRGLRHYAQGRESDILGEHW